MPLRSVFRSAYFLPVVSLTVAMATVWQFLLNPVGGPLNALLTALGLAGPTGSAPPTPLVVALRGSASGRPSASTWCCSSPA